MAADSQPTPRYVAVMRIFVSLILLAAGLPILTAPNFLVHQKPDDSLEKASIGWIGLVIGYWLA